MYVFYGLECFYMFTKKKQRKLDTFILTNHFISEKDSSHKTKQVSFDKSFY